MKYDTQVKKVLSNKWILAWMLKYTVKEFAGYSFSDIAKCMEEYSRDSGSFTRNRWAYIIGTN